MNQADVGEQIKRSIGNEKETLSEYFPLPRGEG